MLKKISFILSILLLSIASITAQPSLVIVAAESDTWLADVQNKLTATGEFSTVDYLPASASTPTASEMQPYDVVFVWSQDAFFDAVALGDNLATYIENGGNVITSVFALADGLTIGGEFANSYRLIEPATSTTGQQTLGAKLIPEHPILNQVASFDGGTSSFRANSTTYNGDLVAEWSDGIPLIVTMDNVGPQNTKRVDLNFWPTSSDGYSGGWVSTTDGVKIMTNAILWAADPFTKILSGDIVADSYNSYTALWADYDLDGFSDLFVSNRNGANYLYHNNGDGTFSAVTAGDLGTDNNNSFGGAWGDFDNDGDPDLFVANGGFLSNQNNSLYVNNGDGTFSLIVAGDLGDDLIGSLSGAWADYDLDGHLDLAVTNYDASTPNFLYHNNGDGTFTKVSDFFLSDLGNSWEAVWGDYNGDMFPELYIANAGQANFLYQNNGGSFVKITTGDPVIDIATTIGASWVDFDGDSDLDLFVPVSGADNFLYVNDGAGNFTKNLTSPIVTEPGASLSAAWGDYDNDGGVDLYLGQQSSPGALFRNTGGGNFVKQSSTFVSRDNHGTFGAAWEDFDNDGDLDLFVANFSNFNFFYENRVIDNNKWIDVELRGTASNADGLGSKVWVEYTDGASRYFEVNSVNGRGQSSRLHIGLANSSIKSINVQWPSGMFQSAKPSNNQNILIEEFTTTGDRPKILLVTSEYATSVFDVQRKLIKQGYFEIVQNFSAQTATPSLETLSEYDAVLVWSNFTFNDPILLGNNLADYIDQGGNVVKAMFSMYSGYDIQGRLATDYTLLGTGSFVGTAATLGTVIDPTHPIMNGVTSFDGGTSAYRSSGALVDGNVIAEWNDGLPLIVVKENVGAEGSKRVDLNLRPPSSDILSSSWLSTSNGAEILTNALLWAMAPPDPFTRITTGDVTNDIGSSWAVAWGDLDNNPHLDLFVGNQSGNDFLYVNNADGTFNKNTTDESVLDAGSSVLSGAWADFDNDGLEDLFVVDFNGNSKLYKNNGDGTLGLHIEFMESTTSSGSAWADYDSDGYLDLFVASSGTANLLFHNNGDGTFEQITTGEIVTEVFNSFGCVWGDYDDDGNPDIFIANFGSPNSLFRNNGDGTFTKITEGAIATDIFSSFTASWADYDNDSDLDLFVGNYSNQNNNLYENNGDGTFTPVLNQTIVTDASNSIGSAWQDFDNDGYIDLFVSVDDGYDKLYQNNGDGTFTDVKTWAPVTVSQNSRGLGWADYNEDGNQDLFVADIAGQSNLLFYNNGNGNNWISLKLRGVLSNASAVGAKVYVTANGQTQMQEVTTQNGFSSQSSINIEFGFAEVGQIDEILINWPSGIDQFLFDVPTNQFITIEEDIEAPLVESENFPAIYDKNGGVQGATITVSDNQGVAAVYVGYGAISEPVENIVSEPATQINESTFGFDLSVIDDKNEALGMAYIFEVIDYSGNSSFSNVGVTHVAYLGNDNTPSIPGLKFGSNETDYQMVAIPYELTNSSVGEVFGDDLGEVDNTKWRIYHYQNGTTSELGNSSSVNVGDSYWLIAKNSATIDIGEGNVPQVRKNDPFQLNLSSGWNQIGNPYNFTISWQEVLDFNSNPSEVDTELTVYNGGYGASDELGRFKGAFVFSSADITLGIPVIRNTSLSGGRMAKEKSNPFEDENWSVDFTLESGDFMYALGGIGMNKESMATKDKFDRLTAPRFIKYLEVNFDGLSYNDNAITKSVVPTSDNQVWEFTVDSNIDHEQVKISWDNTDWGDSDLQLVLFDKVAQKSVDMSEASAYTFTYSGARQFEVYFGTTDFIAEKLTPKSITIGNTHPNPFSDYSTIHYTIPDDDNYYMKLTVYDQLGAVVKVISQKDLEAGFHEVVWDGTNNKGVKLSSGVYFGQIDVVGYQNNLRNTQRILLK